MRQINNSGERRRSSSQQLALRNHETRKIRSRSNSRHHESTEMNTARHDTGRRSVSEVAPMQSAISQDRSPGNPITNILHQQEYNQQNFYTYNNLQVIPIPM